MSSSWSVALLRENVYRFIMDCCAVREYGRIFIIHCSVVSGVRSYRHHGLVHCFMGRALFTSSSWNGALFWGMDGCSYLHHGMVHCFGGRIFIIHCSVVSGVRSYRHHGLVHCFMGRALFISSSWNGALFRGVDGCSYLHHGMVHCFGGWMGVHIFIMEWCTVSGGGHCFLSSSWIGALFQDYVHIFFVNSCTVSRVLSISSSWIVLLFQEYVHIFNVDCFTFVSFTSSSWIVFLVQKNVHIFNMDCFTVSGVGPYLQHGLFYCFRSMSISSLWTPLWTCSSH